MENQCEYSDSIGKPDDSGSNLNDALRSLGIALQTVSTWQMPQEVRVALQNLQKTDVQFSKQFAEVMEPYARVAVAVGQVAVLYQQIREIHNTIGLLYHYTYPTSQIITASQDVNALCSAIEAYYLDNWAEVSSAIEANVSTYCVPSDTKSTFQEGLDAHGNGLYRAVPRIVFPEIERVLVDNGYNFSTSNFITDLKAIVVNSTLDDFPDAALGMPTWQKFVDHVYKSVNTPTEVAYHQGHPVPNRHATIHGRVSYDTQIQSLNALFLVEFMMRLLPNFNYLNP